MEQLSLSKLDSIVKASADINRIRILSMLKIKKMCVCEIAFVLEITQPSVSRHLKKLKAAGFISSEDEGLWTNYYLCPQNLYAKNFIKNIKLWVANDAVLARDKKRVSKADRKMLCCLSG
jgi:ArsR family transcriptional regulator, arsenate/arsenite/antimonite-responsive transcriptional repressor